MLCSARETRPHKLLPVTLQLKWTHQFQFAGYYMALHNGHYKRAGLNVRIVPGGPDVNVTDVVMSGKADFGVGTSDLLLDYVAGKPVQVLGVVFQHSPLVVVVHPVQTGNNPVQALAGRRVMVEPHSADILAMFQHMGLTDNQWERVDHTGSVIDFINNDVDAFSAYLSDEPWLLKQKNIGFEVLSPRSYGIDFYGDNFFTRRRMVVENEKIVEAFCDATRAGWEDAVNDPEAAVDLILDKYPCSKTREHLVFEAQQTLRLMTSLVYPGYMLPARWNHIARTYIEIGMLDKKPDFSDFLYFPEKNLVPKWVFKLIGVLVWLLLLLALLLLYIKIRNMRLEREIEMRDVAEKHKENREYKKRLKLQQLLIRDLHDGLGGIMANLTFSANQALKENDIIKKNNIIENLEKLATEVNVEMRDLMNSLETTSFSWGDFRDSIRRSADVILGMRQIDVELKFPDLPVSEEIGLFEGMSLLRIIREAMNNIARHAKASKATITLQASDDEINISVADNGCGFDVATVKRGRGLANIAKRVTEFAGTFELDSDNGTNLKIVIPCPIRIAEKSGEDRDESDSC